MDSLQKHNNDLLQAAIEAHLTMPLPAAFMILGFYACMLVITLLIIVFVAVPRLRGSSRRHVLPTAALLAGALALLLPATLMALAREMMLGVDIQQTPVSQITTATFESIATEITRATMLGGVGIVLLLFGLATLWIPARPQQIALPPQAAPQTPPATAGQPGLAPAPAPPLPIYTPLQMQAHVRIIRPDNSHIRLHTIDTEIHIGRDRALCALAINDPFVLPHHARIFQQDGAFFLEDKSTSGIYVDGEKIAFGFPFELRSGMRISLGCSLLHFSVIGDEHTDFMPDQHRQHGMLIYLDDKKEECPFVVPLIESVARLGRHQKVQFASQRVSRYHADICYQNGTYSIINKSEGGQTFVDDIKVTQETPLSHGQVITLGDQYVRFELEREDNDAATDYLPNR
jgi:pSer/pThr/pTyr-binding forkhead associated (FHA) protein